MRLSRPFICAVWGAPPEHARTRASPSRVGGGAPANKNAGSPREGERFARTRDDGVGCVAGAVDGCSREGPREAGSRRQPAVSARWKCDWAMGPIAVPEPDPLRLRGHLPFSAALVGTHPTRTKT